MEYLHISLLNMGGWKKHIKRFSWKNVLNVKDGKKCCCFYIFPSVSEVSADVWQGEHRVSTLWFEKKKKHSSQIAQRMYNGQIIHKYEQIEIKQNKKNMF